MSKQEIKTLKLRMYPAKNGDAFLISSNLSESVNILVDGGYASTFKEHIHPDLNKLASQDQIIDLVVATHIDEDHICGLIEFFKCNGDSLTPKIIPVKNVWHNCIRSLKAPTSSSVRHDDFELLKEIQRQGYPLPAERASKQEEVSARQGSSFAALILGGGYKWNGDNGIHSINNENVPVVQLGHGIQLQVIGPPIKRLEQLKKWWLKELRRLGFIGKTGAEEVFDDAFEFLCAQRNRQISNAALPTQISGSVYNSLDKAHSPDSSLPNSSSIAFIAHMGTARLLFLGDAWSEDIELQLRKINRGDYPLIFDAIKLSHHGSLHNTSASLLEIIDSPAYFISTNGNGHNHPDIEVLKAIVDRPCEFKRNLYFSYSTPVSIQMKSYQSKTNADFAVHENATSWIDLTPGKL